MHVRDHFSKFSWAYPLKSKCASEVAEHLADQFCTYGPARILQSDNGREFTAQVISDLKTIWPELVIIHGRPRHPQSQGCIEHVERANGDLQSKLGKWMDQNGDNWRKGLKFVIHAINTSTSTTTTKTPYEVVFGQAPRSDFVLLQEIAQQNIINEEDLPEEILEQIQSFDADENTETEKDIDPNSPLTADAPTHETNTEAEADGDPIIPTTSDAGTVDIIPKGTLCFKLIEYCLYLII